MSGSGWLLTVVLAIILLMVLLETIPLLGGLIAIGIVLGAWQVGRQRGVI